MTVDKPAFAAFDGAGALICIGGPEVKTIGAGWRTLPADYDDATFRWLPGSKAMVEDAARLEAKLLAAVKAEAERRKMAVMTPGGAKKTEYAEKAGEVRLFHSLAGTTNAIVAALGLMSAERRAVLFPWASADAAAFGDTLQAAIERFKTGMATSASAPAIAAAEAKACAAIKAATGVAAKRAAAVAAWP